ncbi:MAG: alanine racemase [Alphaproteobacteria bacterium]|nr:alanine racemase [Alphaproteobacteria bacterium]
MITYSLSKIAEIVDGTLIQNNLTCLVTEHLFYDSRMATTTNINSLFLAFKTPRRNGHVFIEDLYNKGFRQFMIDEKNFVSFFPQANFIVVNNVLESYQKLASYHRQQFKIPIIGITGSYGKTLVKEWLAQMLEAKFNIIRSPKSYNSSIGVAQSILEILPEHELGIFEAGISTKNDMHPLYNMIQPDIGILTKLGDAHNDGFASMQEKIMEKLILFSKAKVFIYNEDDLEKNGFSTDLKLLGLKNIAQALNISFVNKQAYCFVQELYISNQFSTIILKIKGKIYPFQIPFTDRLSLENILLGIVVLIYFNMSGQDVQTRLYSLKPIYNPTLLAQASIGYYVQAQQFHSTYLVFETSIFKQNLQNILNALHPKTKVMAVLKASAYGMGSIEIAKLLESEVKIAYLSVAYIDEAIALKEAGYLKPLMLMNVEPMHFEQIIQCHIEPEIYSLALLQSFIEFIKNKHLQNYPIHLKFNTGMNRLGFSETDLDALIKIVLNNATLIKIKSIFSHLIDGNNKNLSFKQAERLNFYSTTIQKSVQYNYLKHIASSTATLKFKDLQFDMVRIGIAMFGFSTSKIPLKSPIALYSQIAQIHHLKKGDYIGYGTLNKVKKDTIIATIKIGYADGYHRIFGNGKASMYVNGYVAPTIGNICMDLCFIDISEIPGVDLNSQVEVFGKHISLESLAKIAKTIPYEILTSIGSRIKRTFL